MTNNTDREKQAHISLTCLTDGKPVLAIHDKNGRKRAQWIFESIDDMRDFGNQIIDYTKRLKRERKKA